MKSIIKTSTGKSVSVNRVDRREIDKHLSQRPYPVPPKKEIVAYGGFIENVPDFDSEVYREELTQYINSLAIDQFDIVAKAVELQDDISTDETFRSLIIAGVIDPRSENLQSEYIQYLILSDLKDLNIVMAEILYLSTVTQRGIDEATESFRATWDDKPIKDFAVPTTQASYAQSFEDREAARFSLLTWPQFCELTGPEQSQAVAHYRVRTRLDWMIQNYGRK